MSVELNEAQKQEERVKAQQYAELMGTEYVDPFPESAPADVIVAPTAELTDEQLVELLNKRTGATLSSLNDLTPKPTEEEIAAQAKERETAMFAFGLNTGKFKKEDYDAYQLAITNKKDLVRGDITAQLQTAFPELSDDAIQEKVANYFFENLEETDPLRMAREKEIATLSDLQIKNKFKNIVNLPDDFDQYQAGINNKATFERKIQATLPVYTKDVKTALQSLKTFSVEIPDTKNPANNVTVQLEYGDNDLKEVEDQFLSNDMIIRAVKEGVAIDQIKGEANIVLMQKHLPRLISQAAKKYNATQKEGYIQGRKGLIAGNDNAIDVRDENLGSTLNEVYDQFIETAPVK